MDNTCERCNEKLNEQTMVMLELDQDTGLYHRPGELPAGHTSQGGFAFGVACAKAVLKNGGSCVKINRPRRSKS